LPFAGRARTWASAGARTYGGVPSFRRRASATRGAREGSRRGRVASARAFARTLEACAFRSASRRRRGACSSLLCSRKRRRSVRVSPPRPRPGDRRRLKTRLALQNKSHASGAGGRAPAGIGSSRHCAHASFVLQKSVGCCLAQRSAHRHARGAKPLARASDPREREPSEPCGPHAKAGGKHGERRGGRVVGAGRSSSRERPRDRRRLTSARHRKAPPPKGVRRQTELDAALTEGRHLGS